MDKKYEVIYHFKDGVSWDKKTQDVKLSANQIALMLKELSKNENMQVKQQSTDESRDVSDLKSIELIF